MDHFCPTKYGGLGTYLLIFCEIDRLATVNLILIFYKTVLRVKKDLSALTSPNSDLMGTGVWHGCSIALGMLISGIYLLDRIAVVTVNVLTTIICAYVGNVCCVYL